MLSDRPVQFFEVKRNDLIEFVYKNYRGETKTRRCYVVNFYFGMTQYHPEFQFFCRGEDPEKGFRTFAVAEMKNVRIVRKAM